MSNEKKVSEAARALGRRSVKARREKWGDIEFQRRMQEYGKLGGRPRKADPADSKEAE